MDCHATSLRVRAVLFPILEWGLDHHAPPLKMENSTSMFLAAVPKIASIHASMRELKRLLNRSLRRSSRNFSAERRAHVGQIQTSGSMRSHVASFLCVSETRGHSAQATCSCSGNSSVISE